MNKMTLADVNFQGKKALVRVDFNVPQNKDGSPSDTTRIKEAIPTISYIIDHGGSVVLMSHLGRPAGKKNPAFSLSPCAKALSSLLNKEVLFVEDCKGPQVEAAVQNLKAGEILLLENLRFYEAEENPKIDPSFAKSLAALGDVYVNDAFGTAHRKHSSTAVIAQYFPDRAVEGLLMQKEISFLSSLLENPKRPFFAILGGAKVSSKIGVLKSLVSKVDAFFIGGAMTYTFMKAKGLSIGDSLCEIDYLTTAREFIDLCQANHIPLHLATDIVIASRFHSDAETTIQSADEAIPGHWQGVDIGPKTIALWSAALQNAGTIFWNGPLGVFEFDKFAKGTRAIAKMIATLPCNTIVGGGDSVAAIHQLGLSQEFSHISTGGGASLEYLEFGHLPGIDALSTKKNL